MKDEPVYGDSESGLLLFGWSKSGTRLHGEFELQYGDPLAETYIKETGDDMMPLRYISKQSHSLYIGYVTLRRLTRKDADMLQVLEALNECPGYGKELKILHLNGEMQYVTRTGFLLLLMDAPSFGINNSRKYTSFHTLRLYFCREQ